jgi:hypothetical protein
MNIEAPQGQGMDDDDDNEEDDDKDGYNWGRLAA